MKLKASSELSEPATTAFVGAAHRAAVETLLSEFQTVNAGASRLVCLVGAPGNGKTRIVQEFYSRLAQQQPAPPYWPATLRDRAGPESEMQGILEERKRVFPQLVTVPKGATMPWMWWAILCQRRPDGSLAQAMFDDATQLFAHADSLLTRLSTADAAGRAFDGTGAVVGLLGLLGVPLFPPAGAALVVAGAARTGWQNHDLVKRIQAFRKRQQERVLNAAGYGRAEQVIDMASDLVTVSNAVPVVLVIDDAQFADSTIVDTLSIVLKSKDARVLAVTTVWKQEFDDPHEEAPFPAWWHTERGDFEKAASTRIDVDSLDAADAQALLMGDLKAVDASCSPTAGLSRNLITRWGTNPLVLRALIRLPRVRTALQEGGLSEDDLRELPHQIEAILSEYWAHLPQRVRHALAIASFFGAEFLPEIVVMGGTRCGYTQSGRAIAEAVKPFAWVRPRFPLVHSFVERALWEIADHGADEILSRATQGLLVEALVDFVHTRDFSDIPERAAVVVWAQHVRLAQIGLVEADDDLIESTLSLAQYRARSLQFAQAAELIIRAVSHQSLSRSREFSLRRRAGTWLRQSGQFKASLDQLETCQELLEPWDEAGTALLNQALGNTYRYVGRLDDAVTSFEIALEYFDRGGDLRGSAASLYGLGDASRGICKWDQADEALTRCMALYAELEDDSELARTQIRHAMLLRDRYQFSKSLPLVDSALAVFVTCRDRVWEARSLRNRGVIARNAGADGLGVADLTTALETFVEIGDERGVAVTLRNRGDALRLDGRLEVAERELLHALDMFLTLGDDRWVARTKVSLADIYRRTGRAELGLREVSQALGVSQQLGDKHGLGRTKRAEGLVLREMGQEALAGQAFEGSHEIFTELGDVAWAARALAGQASLPALEEDERERLTEAALAACLELTGDDALARRILMEW